MLLHYNLLFLRSSIILAFSFKYSKTCVENRLEQMPKFYCTSSLFSKLLIGDIGEALNNMQLLITLTVTALQLTSVLVLAGAELISLIVASTGLFQIGTENRLYNMMFSFLLSSTCTESRHFFVSLTTPPSERRLKVHKKLGRGRAGTAEPRAIP